MRTPYLIVPSDVRLTSIAAGPSTGPPALPPGVHRRCSSVRSPADLSADRPTSGDASPAPSRKRPSPSGWVRRRVHRLRHDPARRPALSLRAKGSPPKRRSPLPFVPRACARHSCGGPGPGAAFREDTPQRTRPGPLPPSERSPALTHAAASRRETRRPPSSLRRLRCGVILRVHRRLSQHPARRLTLSLRAKGSPPRHGPSLPFVPRACARHSCGGPGPGAAFRDDTPQRTRPGPLPPPERSPALTHAAASRRETRCPPSSLSRLRCGVGLRVHRLPSQHPVRRPALSLRANGSPPTHGHGLTLRGACMRTPYRDRHRRAKRRYGKTIPSAVWPALRNGASRFA